MPKLKENEKKEQYWEYQPGEQRPQPPPAVTDTLLDILAVLREIRDKTPSPPIP